MLGLRRRDLVTLLGGAGLLWAAKARRARAQQPAMPVIGYLSARSPDDTVHLVAAFHKGLAETGLIDGRNVAVETSWAFGQYDRLPAMRRNLFVGRWR